MKLEDIKKEMPKTPEMIHNRIQDEIKKQMENGTAPLGLF